ncbi:ATP synthase subunit I [Kaarinaea lacus]
MKIAEPELATKAKWVISTQLIVSIIVAVAFLTKGTWESLAAVYGGLVSICISLLLLRGIQRANAAAKVDPGKSMRILYIGAVQRFVLVLGLIALGMAFFKLDPVATIVGFALAQAGYLLGSRIKG